MVKIHNKHTAQHVDSLFFSFSLFLLLCLFKTRIMRNHASVPPPRPPRPALLVSVRSRFLCAHSHICIRVKQRPVLNLLCAPSVLIILHCRRLWQHRFSPYFIVFCNSLMGCRRRIKNVCFLFVVPHACVTSSDSYV